MNPFGVDHACSTQDDRVVSKGLLKAISRSRGLNAVMGTGKAGAFGGKRPTVREGLQMDRQAKRRPR